MPTAISEDVFALPYLGYAGTPGLAGFGPDIWSGRHPSTLTRLAGQAEAVLGMVRLADAGPKTCPGGAAWMG